jgi:chromosome segregation ATPase
MDWIFEEAYQVFQQILDGTVSSDQLIPLFCTIILFGILLGRQQIANFVRHWVDQYTIYSKAQSYEADALATKATLERNMKAIKEHILAVKGYDQAFLTQYRETLSEVERLSTTQPVAPDQKNHLQGKLTSLNDCHQKSMENFQEVEQLLKAIAEIERAEVIRVKAPAMAKSAVAEARRRRAQANETIAQAQQEQDSNR